MIKPLMVSLALVACLGCGDSAEEHTGPEVGDPDPELVGRWRGTLDGSFGAGTFEVRLNADASISDASSSVAGIQNCPLRSNTVWGVQNDLFTLVGTDCDGTVVTMEAPRSRSRLQGTWVGRPSGNNGTFDVRRVPD